MRNPFEEIFGPKKEKQLSPDDIRINELQSKVLGAFSSSENELFDCLRKGNYELASGLLAKLAEKHGISPDTDPEELRTEGGNLGEIIKEIEVFINERRREEGQE